MLQIETSDSFYDKNVPERKIYLFVTFKFGFIVIICIGPFFGLLPPPLRTHRLSDLRQFLLHLVARTTGLGGGSLTMCEDVDLHRNVLEAFAKHSILFSIFRCAGFGLDNDRACFGFRDSAGFGFDDAFYGCANPYGGPWSPCVVLL